MPLNPLGVSQSGLSIPNMNTQPYPTLGPAQGGIGPGAQQSAPPEQDADEAKKLQVLAQLMQMLNMGPEEGRGLLAGAGLPQILKQLRGTKQPRGITDPETGVYGSQTMGQPPAQPPRMAMSATPMPPGQMM